MLALMGRPNSYSLLNMDYVLCNILGENGYYVELGANDGLRQSNTLKLERELGWKGILIEPLTYQYKQLKRNRKGNVIVNAACVPYEYDSTTIPIYDGDLMTTTELSSDEIPQFVSWSDIGRRYEGEDNRERSVDSPARTLNSILELADAPKQIGFLSLDVEGAELPVLSGVNHDFYRFGLIMIESRNASKTISYLKTRNYEFLCFISKNDMLFLDVSRVDIPELKLKIV